MLVWNEPCLCLSVRVTQFQPPSSSCWSSRSATTSSSRAASYAW
jgi:hypothetical protein